MNYPIFNFFNIKNLFISGKNINFANDNKLYIKKRSMSKKTFQLISGVVGGIQAIAVAVVSYASPEYTAAINSAIVIVGTAIIEACSQFIKTDE